MEGGVGGVTRGEGEEIVKKKKKARNDRIWTRVVAVGHEK